MSAVHRTLEGAWAACDNPSCELLFHFPDMSIPQLQAIPMRLLLPMLNVIQPPSGHTASGSQMWLEKRFPYPKPVLHREYDLPAVILASGSMEWRYNGKLQRVGGPAKANDFSSQGEWWAMGERLR